ncbi:hypothetical protein QZH41_016271, partial [Actinostola sp. cb2023]
AQFRGYQQCDPYYQSKSTDNLPAERKWFEINQRNNYPMKDALIDMQRRLVINMADPLVKYGVSFISICVSEVGVAKVVASWNEHPIEDDTRRIPNTRAQLSRRVSLVDIQTVPTTEEAIILYEAAGGRLTRESLFGADPLRNHAHLIQERERLFGQTNPDFHFIQSRLANGDLVFFEAAITSFVEITRRLAMEI